MPDGDVQPCDATARQVAEVEAAQVFGAEARAVEPAVTMTVVTRGDVSDDARAYALERLGAVIAHIEEPVLVAAHPAPVLSLDEAVERLAATGERFMFFANAASRRGNVTYHRYDGHYGLNAPE